MFHCSVVYIMSFYCFKYIVIFIYFSRLLLFNFIKKNYIGLYKTDNFNSYRNRSRTIYLHIFRIPNRYTILKNFIYFGYRTEIFIVDCHTYGNVTNESGTFFFVLYCSQSTYYLYRYSAIGILLGIRLARKLFIDGPMSS